MKKYNFDQIIDRHDTNCIKWDALQNRFGNKDLMALWVADMDFATPDFIMDALKKRLDHPVLGYTYAPQEYTDSIIRWVDNKYNWQIKKDWLTYIPGIVKGIAFALLHFSNEGDKVIIQPPVYSPFAHVPKSMNREIVSNPLKLVNGEYQMDFEQLESIIDDTCKVLILANPHNPGGMVWSKETLSRLAEICYQHNILVVSDEIHAEMTFPTFTHHPFPTVSEKAAACSITFMAPSKTFNIAGIVSSYAIVPDDTLRRRFYSFLTSGEFNSGTMMAYTATTAAYTQGDDWLKQMITYVMENIHFVDTYLQAHIPAIKVYPPQASFLIWLDCRELGLSQEALKELFIEKAGLALNDGVMFGKEGEGFMRLNIGTPRANLQKALDQLAQALKG